MNKDRQERPLFVLDDRKKKNRRNYNWKYSYKYYGIFKKIKDNRLKPVIYLPTGEVWPTIDVCAFDTGHSKNAIWEECKHVGGAFAFFPEYFLSDLIKDQEPVEGYDERFSFVVELLTQGKKVILPEEKWWKPQDEKEYHLTGRTIRKQNTKDRRSWDRLAREQEKANKTRRKGNPGRWVFVKKVDDEFTRKLCRSVKEAAEFIGVHRRSVHRALKENRPVKGYEVKYL